MKSPQILSQMFTLGRFRGRDLRLVDSAEDGLACVAEDKRGPLRMIASWGMGWDHVSVSLEDRCPTWDEMVFAKDLFFPKDEAAYQLHPRKADYVNHHEYCLHIWRPQGIELPTPPAIMVGPAKKSTKAP